MNQVAKKRALATAMQLVELHSGKTSFYLANALRVGTFTIPKGTLVQISRTAKAGSVPSGRTTPYPIVSFYLEDGIVSVRNDGLVTRRRLACNLVLRDEGRIGSYPASRKTS